MNEPVLTTMKLAKRLARLIESIKQDREQLEYLANDMKDAGLHAACGDIRVELLLTDEHVRVLEGVCARLTPEG